MAILKYLPILIIPILSTGCYENFTPQTDAKPVLCLNSSITAGEAIEVDVSRSWAYNDEEGERDHSVQDATITIYANGEVAVEDYIPAEGDEIHIVAESATYGMAEAYVTVPRSVPIASVKVKPVALSLWRDEDEPMTGSLNFNMRVSLTLEDNPECDDFFRLSYDCTSPYTYYDEEDNSLEASHAPYTFFNPGTIDYETEPIFKEHIGVFESVFGDGDGLNMFFSDKQFSGKSYTLNLLFNGCYYHVQAPVYDSDLFDACITFYLSTISKSYYNRAIYVWQTVSGSINDMGDLGFTEPMWAYSNVSTGAGVVAARTVSSYKISLKDFLMGEILGIFAAQKTGEE